MSESSEENNIQELKNEYPEFFKKTPSDVLKFALSERVSSQIAEICIENGLEDEKKIEGVARRIVLVLLGKLPKENLCLTFEKGMGLEKELSKKIAEEVNNIILSQIPLLEKKETTKETPKISKKDVYREAV